MSSRPELTPEQIAKQLQRKAAKEAKKAQAKALASGAGDALEDDTGSAKALSDEQKAEIERRRFLKREWRDIPSTDLGGSGADRLKIVTWNVLAQTLVRRELFPGSDCLRWSDRKAMLLAELEQHASADIVCLQECDRLKEFSSSLPNHLHVKGSGPGKQHGLVIFYRSSRFFVRASRLVHLDSEDLSPSPAVYEGGGDEESARKRRGGTRQTKNVGLIVALQDAEDERRGIVVTTTHLFWHPKYAYERLRQCIILLRNIRSFQSEHGCTDWPAVFSGDFNTEPDEATYQLLTAPHTPLPQAMARRIDDSRVVHDSAKKIAPITSTIAPSENGTSTPPTASGTGTNTPVAKDEDDKEDGEGEGAKEDDKSLPNTRPVKEQDGILSTSEMIDLLRQELPESNGGLTSAYAHAHAYGAASSLSGNKTDSFGGRGGFDHVGIDRSDAQTTVQGYGEPAYTCFTPLFRLSLDYLFLLPAHPASGSASKPSLTLISDSTLTEAQITSILAPPKIDQLGEGLPRKGICASDHLAVGCEITW
ncbi:hypothetical protein I317_00833 [Kwoniella heveanensis CBS 569]|nr:hypothetical protein I317_00833 [Kwoniella heveanensis CBS 569]